MYSSNAHADFTISRAISTHTYDLIWCAYIVRVGVPFDLFVLFVNLYSTCYEVTCITVQSTCIMLHQCVGTLLPWEAAA